MSEVRGRSGRVYKSNERLFPEELADALGRSRCYVFAMRHAGFKMPGGANYFAAALVWLELNSKFSCTNYIKKAKGREPNK